MDDRWVIWRRKHPIPPGLFWGMYGKFDPSRKNESGDVEFLSGSAMEPLWSSDKSIQPLLFITKDKADEILRHFINEEKRCFTNVYGMLYDYGVDICSEDRYA